MATLGKTIYDKYGASSHGQNGQGGSSPALMGSHATLTKYNTAQGLLTYISTNMPLEAPGSLSHQDYLDILCYLLVQNNYVPADTVFNESQLSNITLK
jgi:cytochrome c